MVQGNLGKITVKENSIVTDENFFSEVMPLKDGMKNLFAGTILKLGADEKLEHLEGTGSEDPIAVLNEEIKGESKDTSAVVIVFGRVKRDALTFKDGTAVTNAQVEALRKNGIYTTKGEK
ncbi:head decoration protein [Treponema pedis]|uniref:head decoration protein n=1 Tax=Treponema pedis TaxID=409322 RepID=UPI003D1E78E8